jgi:signal transduction histidine kinase
MILLFGFSHAIGLISAITTPTGALWTITLIYVSLLLSSSSSFLLYTNISVLYAKSIVFNYRSHFIVGIVGILLLAYSYTLIFNTAFYETLRVFYFLVVLLFYVSPCLIVLFALIRSWSQRHADRHMLALITVGTVGGLLPFSLLAILPPLIGWDNHVPPDLAAIPLVLLPFGIGAAVMSRQFLHIGSLARRSVVALTVWVSLIIVYSLVLDGLHTVSEREGLLLAELAHSSIVHVIVVIGTFPFLQRWLRQRIERWLFGIPENLQLLLRRLSDEIVQCNEVAPIAKNTLVRLNQMFKLQWAAIELLPDGPTREAYFWDTTRQQVSEHRDEHIALPRPTLVVERPTWLMAMARPLDPAAPNEAGKAVVPSYQINLTANGVLIGHLLVGPKQRDPEWTSDEWQGLVAVVTVLATTMQNALLLRRLQQRNQLLEEQQRALEAANTRLVETQEEERRRLAQDLHDEPLQQAVLLERELAEAAAPAATQRWRAAASEIVTALRAICSGMRPLVLDDLGLQAGLESLVNDLRVHTDMEVELIVSADGPILQQRLEGNLELALYRVTQEALNNCRKHAAATHVTVSLWRDHCRLRLVISDNGCGFTTHTFQHAPTKTLGILGMRERLRPWGGKLRVESQPGGGTQVIAELELSNHYACGHHP